MAKEDEKVSENIEETTDNTLASTENVAKETLDTSEEELNIFADQLKEKEAELDKREKEIAKREAELDKREKSLTKKEPKPAEPKAEAVSFVFNGEITDSLMMLQAKSESMVSLKLSRKSPKTKIYCFSWLLAGLD